MDYHSAIKKNEILPFAAMCLDLENIMLHEISQTEKNQILGDITCMCNLKNKTNVYAKEKHTYRYRKQTSGYQWGEGREEGQDRNMELSDINYCV